MKTAMHTLGVQHRYKDLKPWRRGPTWSEAQRANNRGDLTKTDRGSIGFSIERRSGWHQEKDLH